ncbi:MAG: type I-E CRISPR-associated protein Cas6/Cse3/CasE [Myxococcota bacterium]
MTNKSHADQIDLFMPDTPDLFAPAAPAPVPTVAPALLYLLDLRLDLPGLWRAIRHDGQQVRDADEGYAVHAALFALFGPELAPKPFALLPMTAGARELRVMGYARADQAALQAATERAEPQWRQALRGLQVKAMPQAELWRTGLQLAFQVRVRPTVRNHKMVDGHERDLELDAYQAEIQTHGADAARSREVVYVDWLRGQLARSGAARLVSRDSADDVGLRAWRLSPLYRKAGPVGGDRNARRGTRLMTMPEAEFEGTLEVLDGTAFHAVLARGIGRHRAFGYGMLLVRPASD